MTKLLEIQENLIDTEAAIGQLQRAIADDPNSPALKAMAMSLLKRQEALEIAFIDEVGSLE